MNPDLKPRPAQTAQPGKSGWDRLSWLRPLNTVLTQWAASLSWWRMALLALIVLIAGSWIGEKLRLSHEREPAVEVSRTPKAKNDQSGVEHRCEGDEIRIGGKDGIVICEGPRAARVPAPPVPLAAPASAALPSLASSAPAAAASAKVRVVIGDEDDEDETAEVRPRTIRRTIGGWVGDVLSAILVALFAYLIAAKIIVRKGLEADAKLRFATDSADREAMQRQLVQARLKLLQAQVEPHFLFNTLAAVDYLIETDPKRASVMQKTLIAYLRAALPQMRQESSTLGRELKLIRAYLELLKLRIEERLEFDIKVPAQLESAVFPPMVLQTLVENAIKHGIEPKPEGGRVSVLADVVDGKLRVDVVDTGVGLPDGDIFASSTDDAGLGLDNIRNRLAMLYPGASRMEMRSGYEGGTLVRLTIPYQSESTAPPPNAP